MRITQHSGRTRRNGKPYGTKHNDRAFLEDRNSKVNRYRNIYGDDSLTFDEVEKRYYEEHYREQLDEQNARHIKARHPERVKTMDEFRKSKRYCPEEIILQIGNHNDKVDLKTFVLVINDYMETLNKWNKNHGRHMHILSLALHMDETVPHVHIRRVWDYTDENGKRRIGQEKALQQAGVKPRSFREREKENTRYNNRKICFDAAMREVFLKICDDHGLNVEHEALKSNSYGLELDEAIRRKQIQEREKLKKLKEELRRIEDYKKANKDMIELISSFLPREDKTDHGREDHDIFDDLMR